jgi:hypothetical protein
LWTLRTLLIFEIYNLYKGLNRVDNIKIRRLGWVVHIIRMEDESIQKMFLMGNFIIKDQWENKNKMGGLPEGPITDPRTKRMEVSSEEGQGPEEAVVPWMVLCY